MLSRCWLVCFSFSTLFLFCTRKRELFWPRRRKTIIFNRRRLVVVQSSNADIHLFPWSIFDAKSEQVACLQAANALIGSSGSWWISFDWLKLKLAISFAVNSGWQIFNINIVIHYLISAYLIYNIFKWINMAFVAKNTNVWCSYHAEMQVNISRYFNFNALLPFFPDIIIC